jgi:hypothetical protein
MGKGAMGKGAAVDGRVELSRGRAPCAAALVVAVIMSLAGAGPAAAEVTITSPGPMTSIYLSGDLGCQIIMANDPVGAFFNGSPQGACGTFLQTNPLGSAFDSGQAELFSPTGLAGGTQATTQNYVPATQSAVSGSGTNASHHPVPGRRGLGRAAAGDRYLRDRE